MNSGTTSPDRVAATVNWLVVALALMLPVSRSFVAALAPLVTVLFFFQRDLDRRVAVILGRPATVAALVFIAIHVLSLLWSQRPVQDLDSVDKLRYLLLLPIIATSLEPRQVSRVLAALLCGVSASLVWSYGIALGLLHVGKGYPENPAPTMNHLDYSMFLAVACLLVLAHVGHRPPTSWAARVGWLSLLGFFLGGLFINIGRSGQLAFFAGLVVLLARVLPGKATRRWPAALALTTLALVLVFAAFPVFRARAQAAIDEVRAAVVHGTYDTNQGKRVATVVVAADIVLDHPLLGVGAGDTMDEFRRRLRAGEPTVADALADVPHLHNQYLQVAVGTGAVGLLALATVLVTLLGHRPVDETQRTMLLALVVAFAVGFVGDPFLQKQLPLALFAVLAGTLMAPRCSVSVPRDDG